MRTRQLFCFLTAALVLLLFSFASHGEGRPFITRWKGEAGKELRIPIHGNGYKLIIKRASDGSVLVTEHDCYGTYSYTPSEDGELLVEAVPSMSLSIRMNEGSAEALLRVEQFGTVEWQTMENAFRGCTNLQFSAGIDTPDLSQVTNMSYMFYGCTSFNQSLNNWNVSQVTNMSGMFVGCTSFNQDLGMWKLERCQGLDLDNCGMSVENYSKSLVGWASQTNINQNLQLNAGGLKYNASGKAARKQLIEGKNWRIRGDADENSLFITRWKGEAGKELRIPIYGNDYKLIIKRASDGSVLVTENDCYYTYSYTPTEDGELLVEAGPEGVSSIRMNEGSAEALLRVEQFGTVQWQTMKNAFRGCKKLQFAAGIDTPDLSKVIDMSNMFYGCTSFNQSLNNWDVSKVTDMSYMFYGCTSFNQPLDNWDVSQVTDMRGMFSGCISFNQPLNNWNVSQVQKMSDRGYFYKYGMFSRCTSFNQSLNNWDVSKVTDMGSMFDGCTSFNQPLNNWNVSQVKDMQNMFGDCTSFNQPLNNWDVSQVTYMNWMFYGCTSFNQPLDNWDVSQVTYMNRMFKGCTSFNQDLGMWKLERCQGLDLDNCGMSVENYSKSLVGWASQTNINQNLQLNAGGLKYNASGKAARKQLREEKSWYIRGDFDANGRPFITRWKGEAGKELRIPINGDGYRLIIKRASDGSVLVTENDCRYTYGYTPTEDGELLVEAGAERVKSIWMNWGSAEALLRVEQFGTVVWQTMQNAFQGCTNLQFAAGIDAPDLSQVTDMIGMFAGCTAFNQPLNNWDVSHVTDMSNMFYGCTSFNQDLGMWKLEKCGELGLYNCGMSVENYSKSLVGWAAQANIKQGLNLYARGLKYNASSKAAREKLISGKGWRIYRDMYEDAQPFITRWKGEAGKELRIPINGDGYRLIIKRASDGSVLVIENNCDGTYSYTPTEDGELLVEAGAEGVVESIYMPSGSAEALLRVEQFGTAQWKTMRDAFRGCINLQFAAGIDTPDLIQVSDMSGMFAGCTAFNQPLNNWNVSNVQRMGRTSDNSDRALGMFLDCSSFNQPLDNWDVSKVEGMGDMFAGCTSFDQDLGMWKLERCEKLTLNLCGMSVENYSNSLVGWAAQPNIHDGLHLDAEGLSYNETGKTARAKLKTYKYWTITGDEKASHSIAFVPNRLTLNPAEEKVLVLKKTEIEDQEEVTLTSSDPSTVQIIDAASFKIKGLKLGKATVTARIAPSATHGELTAKCEVLVRVAVTGVSLSQTELTLEKGAKATLVATVVPADATNKNVSWRSDNAGIVTVENGVVTAVAEGQTYIRVVTEDGNFTTECKVNVVKNGGSNPSVAVTGVKLAQNKLTLKKDDSFTLVATVEPNNASNKAVTWSSANAAVATVSDAGLVEAKTVGTATITVTTQDGGFTATCEVTVTEEDVVLTGLHLSPSETRLKVGGEATLSVTYEPAGATQREVTWSTSDAAIVTVGEHGKVKAIAAGEAIITVASKTNASIQATCKVIVEPATAIEDAVFASVVIAPNPFGNQLRIVNGDLRGTYALLNAQGVVVRTGNIAGSEVAIETSDLTSGLYLLRLTAENGTVKTITVVKER